MGFEKSSVWVSEALDGANTRQEPGSYSEAQRLDYKSYRNYLKSLKQLNDAQFIQQIQNDKSLDQAITPEKPK